ncbi:hypothetical protein PINS_up009753 [Pythium insidiosum]|nr:hypothetical protein PINS_up009753 [Pythium insidiosum]
MRPTMNVIGRHSANQARAPPSPEEKRLIELLLTPREDASGHQLVALLRCIKGWPLEGQANLLNWLQVVSALKTTLTTALAQCPRLLVVRDDRESTPETADEETKEQHSDDMDDDDSTRVHTELVYEALRFMAILLENACNKHAFDAVEAVVACLGARNEHIVHQATRVVAMLALPAHLHRNPVDPATYVDCPASGNATLRRRLLNIVEARDAVTTGFQLIDQWRQPKTQRMETDEDDAVSVEYQFYRRTPQGVSEMVTIPLNVSSSSDLSDATDLHASTSRAVSHQFERIVTQFDVPKEHQFALFARIRGLAASKHGIVHESFIVEQLHALMTLCYVFSDAWDVTRYVEKNPELTRALVDLVRLENHEIVPLGVRVAALQVIAALVYDRASRGGGVGVLGRHSNVLSALGVVKGTPHGIFPSLVRFCLAELSLIGRALNPLEQSTAAPSSVLSNSEASEGDMDMSLAVAFVHATTDLLSQKDVEFLSSTPFCDFGSQLHRKLHWIEAVMCLLQNVVSMQSAAAVLTESGVIPALLHVVSAPSKGAHHTSLITISVQALETIVDSNTAAATLYRELNGVGIIIDRLASEISASATMQIPLSASNAVFVLSLLVMLSVSFHAQGIMSAGATSRVIREGSLLSKTLTTIFNHVDAFGPTIFAQASIVVSDVINNDPSSVNQVHAGGVADAYLRTITRWDPSKIHWRPDPTLLPPSSELIMAVPTVLGALSLTTSHAEKVTQFKPLTYLFDMFTIASYAQEGSDHLGGEMASMVGTSLFDLMRQVPTLQSAAMTASMEAAQKLIKMGDATLALQDATRTSDDAITLLSLVTHFCDLLEPIVSRAENASTFADCGGIKCLLKLYNNALPTASSFLSSLQEACQKPRDRSKVTHQTAALSVTAALRSFASHQPSIMLTTLFESMETHLDALNQRRSTAEGLLCTLTDVSLSELFVERSTTSEMTETRVQEAGDYMRELAFVEWLLGLLQSTMQSAQNHQNSRRWFTELSSRSNQQLLGRVFEIDRSIQRERARLAATHREDGITINADVKGSSLWKLASLLLLRFSLVCRGLIVGMSKTLLASTVHHRRSEDSMQPLAPHAVSTSRFLAKQLQLLTATSPFGDGIEESFAQKYYLVQALETLSQTLFDQRKKHVNTLVLVELLGKKPRVSDDENSREGSVQALPESLSRLLRECLTDHEGDPVLRRMNEVCVKSISQFLARLADLEVMRNSPVTLSLVAGSDIASRELPEFDVRQFSLKLHAICIDIILPIWSVDTLRALPVESFAIPIFHTMVSLLKNRIDSNSSAENPLGSVTGSASGRLGGRARDFSFGQLRGGSMDRDDFFRALFNSQSNSNRELTQQPFEADPVLVDNLVAMGFPRARVERALRRVQANDLEAAAEWLISHPNEDDDDESSGETEGASGEHNVAASEMETPPVKTSEEEHVFDGYKSLREPLEDICVQLLRSDASRADQNDCSQQQVVQVLAGLLSVLILSSDSDRKKIPHRLASTLMEALHSDDEESDHFSRMIGHLLVLIVHADEAAGRELLSESQEFFTAAIEYLSRVCDDDSFRKRAITPLLLIIDAVISVDNSRSDSSSNSNSERKEDVGTHFWSDEIKRRLVHVCVRLMRMNPTAELSQASMQLLAKLTLSYELASYFFDEGGVDCLLGLQKESIFPAYKQLACTLFEHILQSPEALEKMMEDKIMEAIKKLSDRYGPPSQMRITPRALLTEVAAVAARNEKVFMKAFESAVKVMRSDSGRTYLIPRNDKESAAPTANSSQDTKSTKSEEKEPDRKSSRLTKQHHEQSSFIFEKLVDRVNVEWKQEKAEAQVQALKSVRPEVKNATANDVGVGTFLYIISQLVSMLPSQSTILAKTGFIQTVLTDFLPSTELCRFASVRRSLKDSGGEDLWSAQTGSQFSAFLTKRAAQRIEHAHRLLITIGCQSGEGPRIIVNELVRLFHEWPLGLTAVDDMSVSDEAALSALHAWCSLIMSILWPRGSTKAFSWDKVVLGGGLKGKYAFVHLLADALRKVCLAHPMAFATCSMLLRPLATLTRSFVTKRVSRLLRKKQSQGEIVRGVVNEIPSEQLRLDSDEMEARQSAIPASERTEDVMMGSPTPSDEAADHFSESDADSLSEPEVAAAHSAVEDESMESRGVPESRRQQSEGVDTNDDDDHEDNVDDDEADEHDEEDDDDDEDEDEDEDSDEDEDEDDDEDESEDEHERMRTRVLRRSAGGSSRRSQLQRLWGATANDHSTGELEEVDEEEFSYVRILDDEVALGQEQRRRAASQEESATRNQGGNSQLARSLVDLFSLDGGADEASSGGLVFGDFDDEEEDDPDTVFRNPLLRHRDLMSSAASSEFGNVGSTLLRIVQDPADGSNHDFIFDTLDLSGSGRGQRLAGRDSRESPQQLETHPLLRVGSAFTSSREILGGDRLAIPRHSSLLRELQELTEQVHTQLPMSFASRTILGRDVAGRGSRNRPPSRNRLSTLSNLLSEFALDVPGAQSVFGQSRLQRTSSVRRLHRDPNYRALRSDGIDSLWSSIGVGASDANSISTRLEQQITQLGVAAARNEPQESSASGILPETGNTESEAERELTVQSHGTGTETVAVQESPTPAILADAPNVEASSDSASVIALASTLGESSLRSPMDDVGSETEMSTSPSLGAADRVEPVAPPPQLTEQASSVPPVLPPPPPTDLMNFTLDLSSFASRPSENEDAVHQPSSHSADDQAADNTNESPDAPGLVCPDGIDPDVFASLPPDMQAEIVAQHAPTPAAPAAEPTQQTSESFSQLDLDMENSSFDRETLEALPPDIRAEVLANERREREAAAQASATPVDTSRAEEMDNASFVASLEPPLREEILATCDDNFLQSLPPQIQAEAMVLRERFAMRTVYRQPEPRRNRQEAQDDAGDIFRRPTLRRMLTSQGIELMGSQRSSRRHHDASGRHTRSEGDEAHPGMLRVRKEEEESDSERILDDRSVEAILRLLFMAQSVTQNQVLQRVITNVCFYPRTRASFRRSLFQLLCLPLPKSANTINNPAASRFPPSVIYGCEGGKRAASATGANDVYAKVISRTLKVVVSLAKQNARFGLELLTEQTAHGTELTGLFILLELLSLPIVMSQVVALESLLELLEVVLSPLSRLPKKNDVEVKDDRIVSEHSEWLRVPSVELRREHAAMIVKVLCLDVCTHPMQERTVQILQLLDKVPSNRKVILDALVQQAQVLASPRSYSDCSTSFVSAAVLPTPQDELKLLRVLHTLSDVCETSAEFVSSCAIAGLDSLWDALSRSLEEAQARGGLEAIGGGSMAPRREADAGADENSSSHTIIEGKSAGASCAMAALLARFLPMVEAFFVVNARDAASMSLRVPDSSEREEAVVNALRENGFAETESADKPSDSETPPSQMELKRLSSTASETGESTRLATFVEANRVLLNLLVREKPGLLDNSLAALIKMPRCRAFVDFDNKRTYFQSAMRKLRQNALRTQVGSSSVRLSVRRDRIFEDSYYALRHRSGAELRRKLHVSFTGEEGIDAGGVTREWYVILAREIFNPNYVLFTSAADSPTFQPNPLSYVNKDHLHFFEFVGKVIGKAVADGQLLDAHFTRSFYKHILQLPISYHDMEAIDPEYYRNLHSILDNPIADLGLELTFSAEQSNFGRMEIVDLIPNGRHVAVTDENKMEYVKLVTHHRMATGIRQQIDAFLKGFHQLVPPELIAIFNENELELLISGMPEIDIDDLKSNTEYANYKPTDPVIRWFWNVLYTFNHEERALFLQFVTGTSKVPLEGFKALEGMRGTQKFNIHKAFGNPNALPSAHTCFNQLDLPEYESEDKLRQCLLLAIREGSEGFGFG